MIGEDGYRVELDDCVVGNRSPAESPLMDSIRRFVEREDPGAEVAARAAGLLRLALVARCVPRLRRTAFPRAPRTPSGVLALARADERIPVEDLGLAASFYSELIVEMLR